MDGGVQQQHITRKTVAKKTPVKSDQMNKPRVMAKPKLESSPPALVRQQAQPAAKIETSILARNSNDSDAVGRDTDHGVAKMNSMIPKPSPRTQKLSDDSPLKNNGRGHDSKAVQSIGTHAAKRLEITLAAGKSDMHKASTKQMHKDRAFIYDQTKAGKLGSLKNKAVDKALGLGGKMGVDAANEKQEKRTEMILEAKQLKPYQKRIKQKNPEAAKREKIASNLKKTKKGAKYADYIGTGVSFVAPQVGAGIKIGAKATKLAAGTGSAIAYESARKGYKKNIDESATGDAMFDSHIAREKADMMRNTRNKMAVSTGASLVASVGSFAVEAATENLAEKTANAIQGGYDVAKRQAKKEIKKPFKEKIRENKSELVNLMQIQKTREDYQKRKAKMASEMMANLANRKKK